MKPTTITPGHVYAGAKRAGDETTSRLVVDIITDKRRLALISQAMGGPRLWESPAIVWVKVGDHGDRVGLCSLAWFARWAREVVEG